MPENRFRNTKGSQLTQILNLQSDRWHTAYSNRGSRSLRLSYMCLRKRAVSSATTFSNSSYHCLRFLLGNVSGLFVRGQWTLLGLSNVQSLRISIFPLFIHSTWASAFQGVSSVHALNVSQKLLARKMMPFSSETCP